MRWRYLCMIFFIAIAMVDALPKKKKIKKVETNDENSDIEEVSGDNGSGDKPKTLERIGFQQEVVSNEQATSSSTPAQVAVAAESQQKPNIQQDVASQQWQQNTPAATVVQQPPYQQNANVGNTTSTTNAFQQPQLNTNLTQNAYQQQAGYTSSSLQTNATGNSSSQTLFHSLIGAGGVANATENPIVAKRKVELKCFKTFGENIKGGMAAPELVKVYENLHECLKGKCNYKKAEFSLQKSLNERILPGQEVFHKYKCYFNWYELIKKACKPEREHDDDADTGEDVAGGKQKLMFDKSMIKLCGDKKNQCLWLRK